MLGKIYKIIPHECCEFYIGSTTDMKKRENEHRADSKFKTSKLYKKIRECGGFDIEVLYEYECENETELRMEERRCYDKLNPALNTYRPYVSDDELKQYYKQYNTENRDKIQTRQKIYYTENRDKIRTNHKIHYEANKDEILAKKRQYQAENKTHMNNINLQNYHKNKDVINAKKREKYKLKRQQQL